MPYLQAPFTGMLRSAALRVALGSLANAEPATESAMDPLVVSALRIPQRAGIVSSSVTVLDPDELAREGLLTLRDALNASPGVVSLSTGGQTGALGSLFIRGTPTGYSQTVVDGVRLGDSTTAIGNFLAAGRTADLGTIEILRGPQGAIHGGESVGGVLWLETPRGQGLPAASLTAEGGSFGSLSTRGAAHGSERGISHHAAAAYERGDNDAPDQDFHQGSAALRLEAAAGSAWTLGTTLRAIDAFYNNSGASDDRFDARLHTLYALGEISPAWTSRVTAGYYEESYDSDYVFGGVPGNYGTDMRDLSLSTDQEIRIGDDAGRVLAGAFVHGNSFSNTIGTDESRTRFGAHAAAEWNAGDHLTANAALRWEDYDSYGDEFTWRLGAVQRLRDDATRLRGGIGTSFRTPTYLDLFGSDFAAGNPALEAESAIGWDIGIDQPIGNNHEIAATFFQNRIDNAIITFPAPPVNGSGESRTEGVELGARGDGWDGRLGYRLAWTWLHKSIGGQPTNAANASLHWKYGEDQLAGVGISRLSAHSWGGAPLDGYTLIRLFASHRLNERVTLHGRIENLLDEEYELSGFYGTIVRGAGAGLYAGITVDW